MVDESIAVLTDSRVSIDEFGRLLDLHWKYKRSLSDRVSTPEIDQIYSEAVSAGAIGGKILGAGCWVLGAVGSCCCLRSPTSTPLFGSASEDWFTSHSILTIQVVASFCINLTVCDE